jgi:hypothetical protein
LERCGLPDILSLTDFILLSAPTMDLFFGFFSSVPLHWRIVLIASVLVIAAVCLRALETEETRTKRAGQRKSKELRSLTEKISTYARDVRQRYPGGDVVVSERDLAEQLRKRPDAVVTALNLLLNQQKVQKAPLNGYWRLNS